MKKMRVLLLLFIVLFVLAACTSTETAVSPAESSADQETMSDEETMADEEMAEHDDAVADQEMADEARAEESMADAPAWQQMTLTNARTGETFTFADFAGQTVFVEPMATWCTNCRRQLTNVQVARTQLSQDAVFIALSLETNISDAELAQYADNAGFDWIFAVMTPEMLDALVNTFGRSITSAPSTPHFIIRGDGSFTELTTGIESPDEIVQNVQAASG